MDINLLFFLTFFIVGFTGCKHSRELLRELLTNDETG